MNSTNDTAKHTTALTLIKMIGSPFADQLNNWNHPAALNLTALYDLAFENRVELLFLQALEKYGLLKGFENKKQEMELRCATTRKIAAGASRVLTEAGVKHVIFKTIKPYPATPNDTDICCLGDEKEYRRGLKALTDANYVVLEYDPMQTLLYHPWGEGKVGEGKKGGTYYVDFYRGIAVDYYEYVNKHNIAQYCIQRKIEGQEKVVLLSAEPELSIVMFHNVFPEKTFQLEHFYLCIYGMANPEFEIERFIDFTEKNHMTMAVCCNLSIIEILHKKTFGTSPKIISTLLNRWGRKYSIIDQVKRQNYHLTYIFTATVFWGVFFSKLKDPFARRSLSIQCFHMLSPSFFWDALKAAWTRTFEKNIYEHQ